MSAAAMRLAPLGVPPSASRARARRIRSGGRLREESAKQGLFSSEGTMSKQSRATLVRTRFRVKGSPDSPTRDAPDFYPPPGVPHAVWSVRMNILASMVRDDGGVAADVCCGHGILAIGLVSSGRCAKAIAVDLSAPEGHPYPAVEVAREKVLAAREATAAVDQLAVEVRLGDGAAPLTRADRVSTLVVAGVGGRTMMRILDDVDLMGTGTSATGAAAGESIGPCIKRLVLNPPAKNAADVRAYLLRMAEAWVIDDEQLCVENEQMHVFISASRRDHSSSSSVSSSTDDTATTTTTDDDTITTETTTRADVWKPFGLSGGDVRGTSGRWKPNAGDAIQWVGVKGDVLDLEALADEVIGPVLRRRRPPLLTVYLRDRLEWTEVGHISVMRVAWQCVCEHPTKIKLND